MNTTLPIEESLSITDRKNAFVPGTWMDIETLLAVTPEGDDMLECQVVSRQCRRKYKRLLIQRKKQLTTIRMIVEVPEQHLISRHRRLACLRLLRVGRPAEDIVLADGIIATEEHITIPLADECALDTTGFITSAGVDGTPTLGGPLDDFDLAFAGVPHQVSVALQRLVVSNQQRHPMVW